MALSNLIVVDVHFLFPYPSQSYFGDELTFSFLVPRGPWCVHGVLTAHRY